MKRFDEIPLDFASIPKRQPNFQNLVDVLHKKKPKENTLFEFFLNNGLEKKLTGIETDDLTEEEMFARRIQAFTNAGYDYTTVLASDFRFKKRNHKENAKSVSMNDGCIFDRKSFEEFHWENPKDYYHGRIEKIEKYLPEGMKFIVHGPDGVLENVITLTGYENLCYMLADDEELVEKIFEGVGSRMVAYYEDIINLDSVGAIISNDDWGFNTQTFFPTDQMRKYVFKWHKKITDLAHKANKLVILHSCGQLERVYDDIIYDLQFDGKHSYEDKIWPVEEAYPVLKGKIAVLGGIDMDYVCRSEPEEIYNRCCAMLELASDGGYALGTGNSIPDYVPHENYLAMIAAVNFSR